MLPVIVSIAFYFLKRKTAFYNLNFWIRQVIIGVTFGIVAMIATLHGVPLEGATANCRDAAPLCAGLLFGGPAGIIAGLIGGIHRWIVAPTAGMYSRVACSVSTIIAGFYAAAVRKFMFEDRRTSALMGFLTAVVMEVLHMTLLFVTHMDGTGQALVIIKICTIPMVFCNGIAVFLSALILEYFSSNILHRHGKRLPRLNDSIQRWMLGAVVISFFLSSFFIYQLQTVIAERQTDSLIETSIQNLYGEINDTAEKAMITLTNRIKDTYEFKTTSRLSSVARAYRASEINIVNEEGIVTDSTVPANIGFNINDDPQLANFMVLNNGVDEYVQGYNASGESVDETENFSKKYVGLALDGGGFIHVGYDYGRFKEFMKDQVYGITKNRHIGATGGLIIVDDLQNIVSISDNQGLETIVGTGIDISDDLELGKKYLKTFLDEECYVRYELAEGYYIIAYYPMLEAMESRDTEVYANTYMEILVFAILFGWIFYIVKVLVVKDIHKVNDSLKLITSGKLDEQVEVRTCVEFDELSTEINKTVDRLEKYTEEAKDRIAKDLELAMNIQQSALPSDFDTYRRIKEVDLYAGMEAAKQVGGDFYDFFMPADRKLVFGVADVSGKGVPGAMFMMQSKTLLRSHLEAGLEIDEAFTEVNNKLCANNAAEMFVTAWMGIIDIFNGHCEFANAGHNPPLVYRKGEGYSYLKCKAGFVLAGMEDVPYKKQILDLNPGDKIFLYTDGVTEAQNQEQELYGEDRLLECLNAHQDANPDDTYACVKESLKEFVGDAEQFDDITILVVEFFGKKE